MKIKTAVFVFFAFPVSMFFAGEIPQDSLYEKAQTEIYKNPKNALKIAEKLLEKEKDPNRKIDIYLLIFKAFIEERNFEKSLEYVMKSKELLNENIKPEIQINVQISAAIQYQQTGFYNRSLATLDEADRYLEKISENNPNKYICIGRSNAVRGMIYKSLSNYELSLEKFLFSIKNFEKAKPSADTFPGMSIVYYHIGYCFMELGKTEQAKKYFLKSADFARKADANALEAFVLKGLSDTYMANRKYSEALKLLSEAENLSLKIGDLCLNEEIYKGMSDNDLALQNIQNYLVHNRKYLETKFKREQNELNYINQSIENQFIENKKQIELIKLKYLKLNISIVFFSLISVSVFLYFIIKKRKICACLRNDYRIFKTKT
ncbi:MAG: tetratricopeptide repeat protein [Flavobacteriaceae bacterium]|jgi:tetratricopeptide (TPR) repeat protein|nr:tetratricopeptide repeat protein [Flavobacteriaceae bacterium]